MTRAVEIIALSTNEKAEVIRCANRINSKAPLSSTELSALAQSLAHSENGKQAASLREQMVTEFYGKESCPELAGEGFGVAFYRFTP